MKKKGLSMNLILVLSLAAVTVSVLVCCCLLFLQTYRRMLIRNAEITSRQAIAQVSSTMDTYLDNMNGAVDLLREFLSLPASKREEQLESFLLSRPDVVAVSTYDKDGTMRTCC